MGAFESTSDPVARLIAEVNRFGPDAPSNFRYIAAPYALATGTIPLPVAITAAQIFYRRAQDAVLEFGDKGSTDLLAKAAKIAASPSSLVMANIDEITKTLAAFADAHGLPASQLTFTGKVSGLVKSPYVVAALVAAGGILYFATRRKGRR
jgi:hypothetical protein